jgi:hypothetical protein
VVGNDSVVLSTLEFDVVWESERLPRRHVAIDVPSPGMTHTERAELVRDAWETLAARGLAESERAVPEIADQLSLLANPDLCIDAWVWADREVKALAAVAGHDGLLGVVDQDQVWLIPARDTAIVEAAVSIAGEAPAGPGRSVSVPTEALTAADRKAAGDPGKMIIALERNGVELAEAQVLVAMLDGMATRGQFGFERRRRDQRLQRADRVVSFHDTLAGRYLYLARPSTDGRSWSTITPADNFRIMAAVQELVEEM